MTRTPQFGEKAEYGPDDVCYRHPDRHSFTLCGRCGKTCCSECLAASSQHSICPDCVRELSPAPTTAVKRAVRSSVRRSRDPESPVVTYSIIGICVTVWVAQQIFPNLIDYLWYAPIYSTGFATFEPWRILTSIFTHSQGSIFHLLFNMYTLWIFGPQLERMLGRAYYLSLYLLAGVGGCFAVFVWGFLQPEAMLIPTVGASGALFGVIAATLVVYRRLQINVTTLAVLLVINIAIGFLPGAAISWQAHLGGMITGAAVMGLLWRLRGPRYKTHRTLAVACITGVVLAANFLPLLLFAV